MKNVELGQVSGAPAAPDPQKIERDKLRKSAAQFESLFIHQLLKTMRSSIKSEDDGFGMSMSYDMFDQQLAEQLGGSLGIAPMLERELGERMGLKPDSANKLPVDGQPEAELRRWHGPSHNVAPSTTPQDPDSPVATIEHRAPPFQRMRQGFVGAPVFDGEPAPTQGIVSSEFGARVHPVTHKHSFHEGLDIAAEQGSEIRSLMPGTVVHAGPMGSYGNVVDIVHEDGTKTRYAHASEVYVRRGDRVDAGETVAAVGSTGASTGPHLHFEVRKDDRAVDPTKYLRRLAKQRYGEQKPSP